MGFNHFTLEPTFVSASTVPSNTTEFQFSGIRLGQLYTVSLTCVFGEEHYDCGTTFLSTRPPALVLGNKVYHQLGVARDWHQSEMECRAGSGHLVSLGNEAEEQMVMAGVQMSDIWTGGNMCPDSPGLKKRINLTIKMFDMFQPLGIACGRMAVGMTTQTLPQTLV